MKIDISQIEPDLLEAISPVLIELEELNEPLDAEEFCDALNRLYDSVSLPTKEVLLLKRAKRQMPLQEKDRFQPRINNNSRQIASQN